MEREAEKNDYAMKVKKIAVIGAGNMGGAIVRGICKSQQDNRGVWVSNPTMEKLQKLAGECPGLQTTQFNQYAARDAEIVILAVKPWLLKGVIDELLPVLDLSRQAIVSIAGGVGLDTLDKMIGAKNGRRPVLFHVIPDTAISVGRGMTFISSLRAEGTPFEAEVSEIFATMGSVAVIEERLMNAATALSSCGIAYAFKYIQACVQAGVELGFRPADALRYVTQTVDGAVALLQHNGDMPQEEIDRVTTPGGMTIRGINELDHRGFTSAVIKGILKPLE